MKKNILAAFSYRLFLILFTLMCLTAVSNPVFAAGDPIAKLTKFSGVVLIKSDGSWGTRPVNGLVLYSGDKLVTKIGEATITFNDGAVMEIRPNSNLLIQENEIEESTVGQAVKTVKRRLRLLLGKMLFKTAKNTRAKTTLETTTMVCGLRGTAGTLSIDSSGQTYLAFTEGGGDTVGNIISGIAEDVPQEVADMNPAQRAAFVAASAAEQAADAEEKAASGDLSDAEAALVQAEAAEAAAQESKAAAEQMLNNPDPEVQSEAAQAVSAADSAIKSAKTAQEQARKTIEESGEGGDEEAEVEEESDSEDAEDTEAEDTEAEDTGTDDAEPDAADEGDIADADSPDGDVPESEAIEEIAGEENASIDTSIPDDTEMDSSLPDSDSVLDVDTEKLVTNVDTGLEDEDRRVTDTIAPEITLSSKPALYTNSTGASFIIVSDAEKSIVYQIDGGESITIEANEDTSIPYEIDISGLLEGSHQITIKANDDEGPSGTAVYNWTIDRTPPVASYTGTPTGSSTPGGLANNSSFVIGASDTNASAGFTYQYSLDGGSTWVTGSQSLNLGLATDGSADGVYNISIRVLDAANNPSSPVEYSWIYDITKPVISVDSKPEALTASKDAVFSAIYTNTEPGAVTFTYALDGSDVDTTSFSGLSDGTYSFVITATDQAGNSSSETITWEIDTTPPENLTVAKTAGSGTIGFTLSGDDANSVTYAWSLLDGHGETIDSGSGATASINTEDLPDGNYTFVWTATDELDNSATGENVGFSFDTYAMDGGDVYGTGSIITGTSTGTLSVAGGDDWGDKSISIDMTGTWSGTHTGSLSLVSGGKTKGSAEDGLWLSTTTGSITGTAGTGTSEYTMLTPSTLVQGSSTFTGTFPGDHTWTGKIESSGLTYTTLTFSSSFTGDDSGGLYKLFDGTHYEAHYNKYGAYHTVGGDYEYEYFVTDSYFDFSGESPVVSESPAILFGGRDLYIPADTDYEILYTPIGGGHGVYHAIKIVNDVIYPLDWTMGGLSYSLFTDPADLGIDLSDSDWTLDSYFEEAANLLARSGTFSGIMGGTGDLFEGSDIALLGTYEPWDGNYSDPSLFSTKILSSEISSGVDYAGFLFGAVDSSVTGGLYALYVKDDGSGGVLSGDFTGTTYPDLGMWDGEGSIAATELASDTGITSETFEDSLSHGSVFGWINGDFGTDGSSIKTKMGIGRTLSLTGNTDFGIFNLAFGGDNYYSNPESAGTWNARAGGIVEFFGSSGYAYWLTDEITGTASDGMLLADLTGKALSFGYYSDVTGNIIGTYDDGNKWQAYAGGYWHNGTALNFSGVTEGDMGLATQEYSGYGYNTEGPSGSYSYNYSELTGSGKASFYDGSGDSTTTMYLPDGTYNQWTEDSYGELTYSEDKWGEPGDDLLAFLRAEAYKYDTTSESVSYPMRHTGWIEGLMGGLDPIWAATSSSPADIVLMGEFDRDEDFDLITNSVYNNAIKSLNPLDGTNTMWSQAALGVIGAYSGYSAGITLSGTDEIPIKGNIIALYVDNAGNAGYLRGSYDGTAYSDAMLWDAAGTLYPDQIESAAGITPANFKTANGQGTGTLIGKLGDSGTIASDTGHSYYHNTLFLETSSIIDETTDTALNWGAYSGAHTGYFTNPESASSWAGVSGGSSDFGAYFDETGNWSHDRGYFIIDTSSGTWSEGIINAETEGRFITPYKAGIMEGNMLGTYNTSDGFWQSTSLGTWAGNDLAFFSYLYAKISHSTIEHYGEYSYTGGGSYSYSYHEDNTYAESSNHPTSSYYPSTAIYYYGDGTTFTSGYDSEGTYFESEGTWDTSSSLADLVSNPMPPSGETASPIYSDSSFTTAYAGDLDGYMGGVQSLWTGTDIPVLIMGEYCPGSGTSIWYDDDISSYNSISGTYTTYDGGAYYGFIGGIRLNNDDLEGKLMSLYIDPDGNAGFLTGYLSGEIYPDIEMFEMDGTLNRVPMATTALSAEALKSSVESTYTYMDGSGEFEGGGYISMPGYYNFKETAAIPGQDWGLWYMTLSGEYSGTASDSWYMDLEDHYYGEEWVNISGTKWSDSKIDANVSGAWVDIGMAQTGIAGGELVGTFNPSTYTWESVSAGAWMDTDTFLSMVGTTEGRAKLDALNIPYIEIGRTDLSYSSGGTNLTGLEMKDMIFFSYSTGEKPRIWASGDVTGTTNGSNPIGETVVLTGSGFDNSVIFRMENYASGGNWGASVSGSGTVSSHNIMIEGAAAGTVDSSTEFSGTASGVTRAVTE